MLFFLPKHIHLTHIRLLYIQNKNKYIKNIIPNTRDILSIKIQNNIINEIYGLEKYEQIRTTRYKKLIENVCLKYKLPDCVININIGDFPVKGVLNFCRNKETSDYFLIPNHKFTNDNIKINGKTFDNFNEQKKYIRQCHKLELIEKIYTSCIPHKSKIEYFDFALKNKDICDGYCYIGLPHKLCNAMNISMADKLVENKLAGHDYVEWSEHLKYKFTLYNDGNSLSDRMRLLLSTNSIIIRQKSNYEEFYTYLLKDKINYIEYNNINELRPIFDTYNKNNIAYTNMVYNNKLFVDKYLDYNEILFYTYLLIKGLNS